jgi:cAMP phosphodiesterase
MKVGDLVRSIRGYSEPGLVVSIKKAIDIRATTFANILWPDVGKTWEREIDLKVIS